MIKAYVGLLRADGTEPPASSGYQRVYIGEVEKEELEIMLLQKQVVFPDVTDPGCGVICAAAIYDRGKDGEPMDTCDFPEALDVHSGVVPVIHKGRLWRGVEARAKKIVCPGIMNRMGGSLR